MLHQRAGLGAHEIFHFLNHGASFTDLADRAGTAREMSQAKRRFKSIVSSETKHNKKGGHHVDSNGSTPSVFASPVPENEHHRPAIILFARTI